MDLADVVDMVKYFIYAVFAYLSLDIETFTILMALMSIDSFVGAIKAVRLGYKFSFKTLLWGITMKFIFLLIPLILALVGKSLSYNLTLAVDIVIAILTVAESYSILGNIYSAKNKVEIEREDLVSTLITSLRNILKNTVRIFLKKLENMGK